MTGTVSKGCDGIYEVELSDGRLGRFTVIGPDGAPHLFQPGDRVILVEKATARTTYGCLA